MYGYINDISSLLINLNSWFKDIVTFIISRQALVGHPNSVVNETFKNNSAMFFIWQMVS